MIEIPRCPHLIPGVPAHEVVHGDDGWHMAVCPACYVTWRRGMSDVLSLIRVHGVSHGLPGRWSL